MNKTKTDLLTVSLPVAYIARIKEQAKTENKTISGLVKTICEYWWWAPDNDNGEGKDGNE